MAIFSSHILNSLNGHHATDVKVSIFILSSEGERKLFFEGLTDQAGRIHKEINLSKEDCFSTFEMIVMSGDYFKNITKENFKKRIVSEIVVRFSMTDSNKK